MSNSNLPNDPSARSRLHPNPVVRSVLLVLGFVCFGVGVVGAVVPGLPTTVFVLLAGFCWAKSSVRFHDYLMRHRVFGKMLDDWHERRAMPRSAKYLAWSMMSISSLSLFVLLPADRLWLAVLVGVICLISGLWMARLPDA